MKGFFKVCIISLIVLLFLAFWLQKKSIDKGKRHFETFNSAEIDSEIESVRIAYKGTEIELNDGRKFVFYPFTNKSLNESNVFTYSAEKGDRVVKKAFSDTIHLYQKDKKLRYTFKKFK